MTKKLSSTLCGVAGEYFVAAELSRRGYIASITLRNTRGVDILASNADATKSVGVQVKTNQRGVAEWILDEWKKSPRQETRRQDQGALVSLRLEACVRLNCNASNAMHLRDDLLTEDFAAVEGPTVSSVWEPPQ